MSDVGLPGATARLRVDASGVRSGVSQANSAFSQLEKVVATNWWGLKNLGLAFAALPAAVATGVFAAVKASSQYEDALVGVARTTNEAAKENESAEAAALRNADSLKVLEGELAKIAQSRPIATVEILGIAESAGALGVAQEDVARFTAVVADLSATTNLTSEAAATNLARIAGLTGLTGAQYDNLASAILEAGRTTAATESEIVSTATRLAGVASVVGLTAEQVIAISATLQSVGVKTQAGGTAIQKTFIDIQSAVSENGQELQTWARLTQESTADFAAGFKADASNQLLKVVQGLGSLAERGIDANAVLKSLGITEANQVRALTALAAGQNQTANAGLRLSENLNTTNAAFAAATASADAAEKKNKTLSAQIQILKNNLFALGKMLGDTILPILKPIVGALSNFITGVRALPGPIKGLLAVVVGIVTILSGLAAVVLIVGSRLVIAVGAFTRLKAAATSAIPGLAGNTAALNANAAAAGRAAKAQIAASTATTRGTATAVGGAAVSGFGKTSSSSSAALKGQTAAAVASGAAISGVGTKAAAAAPKLGAFAKGAGIVGVLLTAATIGLTLFGSKVKKQEAAANDATSANAELTARIKDQLRGVGPAADGWVRNQLAMAGATDTAVKLGVAQDILLKIINGTANQGELNSFYDALKSGQDRAIPGTKELGLAVNNLMKQFKASADEAGAVARKNGQLTQSDADLEEQFRSTTEAAKKRRDALLDQVSATLDYIDASFSARSAVNAVSDAQAAYREALRGTGQDAERVADAQKSLAESYRGVEDANRAVEESYRGVEDAERAVVAASKAIVDSQKDIVKAQEAIVDAQEEVVKAQEELDESRAKGLRELQDAEGDLADSRDSYLDGLDDISDKEEALAELRAGPEIKDMRDAINKLRDANLNFVKSQRKVEDAEFQLQYLREEGASQRDIEDAELALAEAREEVLDANDDLASGEEELADLRDTSDLVKEIERAERDLAQARRESQQALVNIGDKEREVNDIRAKIAADAYYKDALKEYTDAVRAQTDAYGAYEEAIFNAEEAQRGYADAERGVRDAVREVADAHRGVRDALNEVRDAERELASVRRETGSQTDVRDAALAVEKAIYDQAKAMVELRKQDALRNNRPFDASDEAAAMAEELEKLVAQAPTPEIAKRLRDYIALLRKVPKIPKQGGGGAGGGKEKEAELPDVAKDGFQLPPEAEQKTEFSVKETLKRALSNGVKAGFLSWPLLTPLGALGLGFAVAIGTVIKESVERLGVKQTIINALTGGGAGLVFSDEGRKIGKDFINGFFDGLGGEGDESVGAKIGRFFHGYIEFVKKIFGISSPSTVMIGIGADVILGFIEGVGSGLLGVLLKAAELPGKVIEGIGDILTPVKEKGKDAIKGFLEGVDEKYPGVKTFFEELPGKIRGFIGDIFGGNKKKGEESVDGIKRGAEEREDGLLGFFRGLPGRIRDNIGNTFEAVKGKGNDVVEGIRRGIDERFPNLFETLGGLYRGIIGFFSNPIDTLFHTGQLIFFGLYKGLYEIYTSVIEPFLNFVHRQFARLLGPPKDDKVLLVGTGKLIMGGLQVGLAQGWLGVRDQLNGYHQEMANFTFEPGLADAVRGASSTASGATIGAAAGVTNNWNFNLEANTNANPQELIGEFLFASRVRTR